MPFSHSGPRFLINYGLQSSFSSNSNAPSDEMMRKDIEEMREEAKKRLLSLNAQVEDMLEKHHQLKHINSDHDKLGKKEEKLTDKVVDHSMTAVISVDNIPEHASSTNVETTNGLDEILPPPHYLADSTLLQETRWKVVIRVGSARENAVLEGIEKPLFIHLVIDFASDALLEGDDLLQGKSNGAKVMEVREAWIGAASLTEGRQRDVKIKPTGGWKVMPGQGPKGIDILRFYFDVDEEISHEHMSTLRIPGTRIYCTSGIFNMEHHSESEAFKDYLRSELDRLVHKYEDLTLEGEQDERLFSMEGVKRAKQMMDLRTQIKAANKRITQARIRDPEKAMLRLSRRRDVGVTKEGQVCYRESNEYLVLGKMEMASVDKPLIEPQFNRDTNALRP